MGAILVKNTSFKPETNKLAVKKLALLPDLSTLPPPAPLLHTSIVGKFDWTFFIGFIERVKVETQVDIDYMDTLYNAYRESYTTFLTFHSTQNVEPVETILIGDTPDLH